MLDPSTLAAPPKPTKGRKRKYDFAGNPLVRGQTPPIDFKPLAQSRDRRFDIRADKFVHEYLKDGNGTQAAIRAGYAKNSACSQAWFLLSRPYIRQALQELRDKRLAEIDVDAPCVLRGLYREATYDGEGSSHAARVTAWMALGRHFGMFQDKVDVNMRVSLEVLVNQAILPAQAAVTQIEGELTASSEAEGENPAVLANDSGTI